MERKNLAIIIIVLCALSLLAGIFKPAAKNNAVPIQKTKPNISVFENVDTTGDRIALLNIDGVISADAQASAWQDGFSLDGFLASIEKVRKDKKVKAVLLRINSPGGTVAASQDIYDSIIKLRKEKPVVVSMADVTASGGYYISSAADRIVAQRGTMTGSIGVIFNFMDFVDLENKIGISSNVIKSGKFKDAGSSDRKMTPEEKDLFQSSINIAYKQFINDITSARVNRNDKYEPKAKPLTIDTLKKYADGRVFLGEEALQLGFIDAIGSQEEAANIASLMAGYKNPLPIVSYNKVTGLKSFLMGIEGLFPSNIKAILPFSYTHNARPLLIWE